MARRAVSDEAEFPPSVPPAVRRHRARQRGRNFLPVINWDTRALRAKAPKSLPQPPAEKWKDQAPLPEADVVVLTWTSDEWNALDHVFFGHEPLPKDKSGKTMRLSDWRTRWLPYRRNFYRVQSDLWLQRQIAMSDASAATRPGAPSLDPDVLAWGRFRLAQVGNTTVVLLKSELHLNQDGQTLPLRLLVRQIVADARPGLILSTGTAGAVRDEDGLGDVLVSNAAKFQLDDEFGSAEFNGETYSGSAWTPSDRFVKRAERLLLPVDELPLEPATVHFPYGISIVPKVHTPRIKIVDSPVLTTDSFEFGTTKNRLGRTACCVEMDDAVIAMECDVAGPAYGFVRNASDPVISAKVPERLQSVWANVTYHKRGLYTSYNSAVATWAMIAGYEH